MTDKNRNTEPIASLSVVEYLHPMIVEMRSIALDSGFLTLAYLLDMAALEARQMTGRMELATRLPPDRIPNLPGDEKRAASP